MSPHLPCHRLSRVTAPLFVTGVSRGFPGEQPLPPANHGSPRGIFHRHCTVTPGGPSTVGTTSRVQAAPGKELTAVAVAVTDVTAGQARGRLRGRIGVSA